MSATAQGLDFPFADPANLHDDRFFDSLAKIRESDPVFFSEEQGGWLLTAHEDVNKAFKDSRFSSQRLHVAQYSAIPEEERASVIPNMMRYVPEWIINIDDDKHSRIRRLVLKSFGRRLLEAFRPEVERICAEVVQNALKNGSGDFVQDVAFPIPARVIAALLGLPDEHVPKMRKWAVDFTTALASAFPSREVLLAAEASMEEMNAICRVEIEKRKTDPKEDLLTKLVQAREDQEKLSEDELLGLCHVIIVAGHDTTANSLGMGLVALLRNPEQRELYLSGDVDGLKAMAELSRYISMSSTQIRIIREPVELRGKQLQPGQVAFLMIASANRDPAVFANPDTLDFNRANVDEAATFAPGLHHCVGHFLARMEMDVLFKQLFAIAPNIELVSDNMHFSPNYAFRNIEVIPVRYNAN